MTFSSDASRAAELTGIRKTLRTVFPPVTDRSAAVDELLAAIERACGATRGPSAEAAICVAVPMAGLMAPRAEAAAGLRA